MVADPPLPRLLAAVARAAQAMDFVVEQAGLLHGGDAVEWLAPGILAAPWWRVV